MQVVIAVAVYAFAMVVANLTVAAFGPWVSPINAFVLIGLDLSLRDYLHTRLKTIEMFVLIAVSGAIAYFLNPKAGQIAMASSISFMVAGVVDWAIFSYASGSWLRRSLRSNVGSASVDSLLFPTLAWGLLMPGVVVLQFAAKVAGSAFWAMIIKRATRIV